jgi:hypothetical protein
MQRAAQVLHKWGGALWPVSVLRALPAAGPLPAASGEAVSCNHTLCQAATGFMPD